MSASRSPKHTIDALNRGLDVLEILAATGGVRLAELTALLDVSRATAFRILTTLQSRGYVEHHAAEHIYRLGAGASILAAQTEASALVQQAEPVMRALRDLTHETVNLALLRGGRLAYGAILESSHTLRMSGTVGEEAPLHATAIGKAVLAGMPLEVAHSLVGDGPYRRYTSNTCADWSELRTALETTAARGYAEDDEEMDEHAACVAVAIVGRAGQPVGAMSVAGLAARLTAKERVRVARLLREKVAELQAKVGSAESTA